MKKVFISSLLLCSTFLISLAQSPQKFSYQAVAVDASGLEMKNTSLCIRATIISNAINGTQQYVEVHSPLATDEFGLFTIEIGEGDQIGGAVADFAGIQWGIAKHFLRIEMSLDAQGCTNFILVGTNQLLSVPYALHAERSNKADIADSATVAQNSYISQVAHNAYHSDTALFAMTTIQNLNDADADPTNELQNLQLNGDQLSLSGSNAPPINLTAFNVADPDADPTNEIQNLQLNGNNLSLSGSNAPPINLPGIFTTFDPDHDPTNELQNLTLSGTTLILSGNTAPPINVSDFNAADPDHDPTNELQNLSANGSMLSLSGSNAPPIDMNAADPDTDPANELQELTFDSTQSLLGLSGSNTVINLSTLTNFNASGSDLDYPQGVANAKYLFVPDDLTVPADSVFYVVASEDEMLLPGVGSSFGRHLTGPNLPIFKPGTKIDNCRCIGFYKESDPFFEPVIVVLKENQGTFYQVPFGKNFIIKSGLDQSTPITLNGYTLSPFSTIIKALVIPEGIQVKNLGNDEIILTGYLVNK